MDTTILSNTLPNTLPTKGNVPIITDPASLLESFMLAQDLRERSRQTYRKALKQFFAYIGAQGLDPSGLTRQDILEYKEHLRNRGLSAYTISVYLVSVGKLYEWTEGERIYPNIAKGIKGVKKPRGFRKEALTVAQVKAVLQGMNTSTLQGKRDHALLNLLIRTGLRTIEVVRANIGDIRQEGGEALLYIQGKGRDSKDDFVLLTEETLRPLREYQTERGNGHSEAPLFACISNKNKDGRLTTRSLSRIVKNHLKRVGLEDGRLTAHSFRHTAVTLSLLGGATVQEAQSMARHADINTTMIYAHNIERIAKAPERKIDAILNGHIEGEYGD